MKILVLSDSHRYLGNMYEAVEKEKPDLVVHLGDHDEDAEELHYAFSSVPIVCVCGNCDHGSRSTSGIVRTIGGVPVFMTHGHLFGVKSGVGGLLAEAKRLGARIALFGHTHRAFAEEKDGVLLLNPGSCGGGTSEASYAVVQIEDQKYTYSIQKCD